MDFVAKTPREVFHTFSVSKTNWTQVPDPISIFGHVTRKIRYLKKLYEQARIDYDRYMSSLEYEVICNEKGKRKTCGAHHKYVTHKRHIPPVNDLPKVKEALPNNIAKDKRI